MTNKQINPDPLHDHMAQSLSAQKLSDLKQILNSRRRAPLRARRATTMEIVMADDKSKTGNPDRQRINTSQRHELRDSTQRRKPGRWRIVGTAS